MIRLIVIRHGSTALNVGDRAAQPFRGLLDVPLSDKGVAQAEATARRLAPIPLSAVYASPLRRALDTAAILARPHGLAPQAHPDLSSLDYGEWAGRPRAEVARLWPDLYNRWRTDPFAVRFPGGDSVAALRDRAAAAVHDILARHASGETIALVSHEIVTRSLVCALAGLPDAAFWRIRQDLCGLTTWEYEPSSAQFVLAGLNDTCHVAESGSPSVAEGAARFLLLRHGQTAWNLGAGEERFRGRTDLPLDSAGRDQAAAVAHRLKDEPIAAIYTSPLLRTRQTAEPLVHLLGAAAPPLHVHEGLVDVDYGDFQGLTHSEAAAAFPEQYALWRTSPGRVSFPGGESLAGLRQRLLDLLDHLAAQHAGQTVLLVGHQIVNKVAACSLLGLDLDQIWRVEQDTCGLDVFQYSGGAWLTLALNDTCHLRPGAGR